MARYPIPPDIREREKVVGGIFTVSQTLFLALAALVFFAIVSVMYKTTNKIILSAIVAILAASIFLPFAFFKKKDYGNVELAQYLIYLFRYKKSRKEFPNINENYKK